MPGLALKRNRIVLLVVVTLSPLLYFVQMQRRKQYEIPVTIDPVILQRLQTLKERLRDAEFQNAARSQELITLKAELAKVIAQNARSHGRNRTNSSNNFIVKSVSDSSLLSLPSIYNQMPHLMHNSDSLVPSLQVSKDRIGVSLAFGIPTIKREKMSYLLNTIASMLDGMTQEDKDDSVIVIFIGETNLQYSTKIAKDVRERFDDALESGLLEVIAPQASYYPDLDNLPLTFGDSKDRVKWRTKQNLDFSYLMMYCQRKARFYVQLEDDLVATPSFASTIKTFARQQDSNRWMMLEFSALGFIGKLFRSRDLNQLVEFFLMFHRDKPVDWLLDHILWVKVCNPEKDMAHCNREKAQLRIRFKPSLFQHVGKESSLKGKRQNLIDKDFKKAPLFQAHLNPKGKALSSLEPYQTYTVERAYIGQTFFWCYPPKPGDVIRIQFDNELQLERFRFKTGNLEHPGDIMTNATVEVMTAEARDKAVKLQPKTGSDSSPEAKKLFIRNEYPVSSYTTIGQFDPNGLAQGLVEKKIGKIVELRIRVIAHGRANWVIFSEIYIVPMKAR